MSNWTPYKIPPTLVPEEGVTYVLSFANNATPTKNPSQFLEWKEITSSIPNADQGDILYWSGSASDGKWSVLSAPSVSGISVLIHTNGVPQWARTASCN